VDMERRGILPDSSTGTGETDNNLDEKCTTKLRIHSTKLSQQGVEIRLEALAEMTLLIQATQAPSQDLGTRSLIYEEEEGKPACRNRNLLSKERLSPIRHLRLFGMWQNGPYTPVLRNRERRGRTTLPNSKHRTLLRR